MPTRPPHGGDLAASRTRVLIARVSRKFRADADRGKHAAKPRHKNGEETFVRAVRAAASLSRQPTLSRSVGLIGFRRRAPPAKLTLKDLT
jgi:hypothetical protein